MIKELRKLLGQLLLGKAMDVLPDSYFKTEYVKFINEYLKYL